MEPSRLRPVFEESTLLAEAEQLTGLSDWGEDDSFRIGLRVFADAMEAADPPDAVRLNAHASAMALLGERLQWIDDERRHPEIVEISVERPVIIIGMPRTGTTVLQDLLALDRASRAPAYWEAQSVWPATESATFHTDPRIATAQAGLDALLSVAPEVAQMLPMGAELPAECNRIMMYHFYGPEFGAFFGVPDHNRWVAEGTAPGLYRTHRRILQQMSWRGPRGRWTLKSPSHLYNLGDLVAEYPDACLIWTHRDPIKSLASLTDLIGATTKAGGVDDPDKPAIAAEVLGTFGAALLRGLEGRCDPRVQERVIDIAHRDVVGDPHGTVRRIHEHFDLPFTAAHADAMHRFAEEHPRGNHQVSPEECEYDTDLFRERFADYYERFAEYL